MNKFYLFGCVISAFVIVGFSSGPANVNGTLSTMAPGEDGRFCGSSGCHVGNAFNTQTTLEVKDADGNLVTAYMPGATYTVSTIVTATTGTPDGYGFQMVGLKDADNTDVGGWSTDLPSGVQAAMEMDRTYHEHQGTQDINRFTIEWTAPDLGTGDITFYAAGNAVNRNGSASGDGAATASMTIQEDVSADVFDLAGTEIEFNIFPNPVVNQLNIRIDDTEAYRYRIQNLNGRTMAIGTISNGTELVNMTNSPAGIYLVSIISGAGQHLKTTKLIKE